MKRIKLSWLILIFVVLLISSIVIGGIISNYNEKQASAGLYLTAHDFIEEIDQIEEDSKKIGDFKQAYDKCMNHKYYSTCITLENNIISDVPKKYSYDSAYLYECSERYMENAEKYIETGDEKYKKEIEKVKEDVLEIKHNYEGCYERQGIFTEEKKAEPLNRRYSAF